MSSFLLADAAGDSEHPRHMTLRHLDRPAFGPARGLLDRPMPVWVCAIILLGMSLIPSDYVWLHRDPPYPFTSLILFGGEFEPRQLPELKALHPYIQSRWGYDAQFYANIALDPTLRRHELPRTTDLPAFRFQRWLLPAMAYAIGFGQPGLIIPIYALLNLFFWFGLVALMTIYLRARSARDYACLVFTALTTGVLISIERSLTDLPATALGLGSAMLDGVAASVVLALSMLTKPTFGLLIARYAWPLPLNRREALHRAGLIAITLGPPILLVLYIYSLVGEMPASRGNLGLPVIDWVKQCWSNGAVLSATPFHLMVKEISEWEWKFFEFVAPLSMMVQVIHLAIWRKPDCPVWWLGASFALLFLFLTHTTLVEHIATTRTALPLTVVFNLRLAAQRGGIFWGFFIAGNLGLLWCWHDMVCWCLR